MAAMPISNKNHQKSSSPEANNRKLETWYIALGMQVLLEDFGVKVNKYSVIGEHKNTILH